MCIGITNRMKMATGQIRKSNQWRNYEYRIKEEQNSINIYRFIPTWLSDQLFCTHRFRQFWDWRSGDSCSLLISLMSVQDRGSNVLAKVAFFLSTAAVFISVWFGAIR